MQTPLDNLLDFAATHFRQGDFQRHAVVQFRMPVGKETGRIVGVLKRRHGELTG